MSKTATQAGPSGLFATARRGGLTAHEITEAERLRSGPRPLSWQHIAARTGRCAQTLQAYFATRPEPSPVAIPEPVAVVEERTWFKADIAVLMRFERREIGIRAAAKQMGCSPHEIIAWQDERVKRGVGV